MSETALLMEKEEVVAPAVSSAERRPTEVAASKAKELGVLCLGKRVECRAVVVQEGKRKREKRGG